MTQLGSPRADILLRSIWVLDGPLQFAVSAVDTPSFRCLFHCVVPLDVKRKECFFKRRIVPKGAGVGGSDRLIQAMCC